MFGDSSVGLLFKVSAQDNVSDALKKIRSNIESDTQAIGSKGSAELDKLTGSSKGLGASFAGLANPVGLAAAAIASVATVAGSAAAGMFGLAKNFSDYGSAVKDASDKTGLHAETLTALKYAGDQSGASIEQISKSVSKFSLLVTDAANGSKEATAKLKSLGLEPQAALRDLDASLSAVFKRIVELKPGFEQNAAAAAAFGAKVGSDLLPFIKQFDGDLPGLIKKAKELGVTLSDDDVEAADAFGDQLAELKSIAQSVANTFAREFTPGITSAMGEVGKLLIQNKEAFKEWGTYVGDIIRGVSAPTVELPNPPKTTGLLGERPSWFPSDEKIVNTIMDYTATGALARTLSGENAAKRGKALREAEHIIPGNKPVIPPGFGDTSASDDLFRERAEKAKADAEKAAKERENARKEEIQAQIQFNQALAEGDKQRFETAQDNLIAALKTRGITQEEFDEKFIDSERKFTAYQESLIQARYSRERALLKNKTAIQTSKINENNDIANLNQESKNRIDAARELIKNVQKEITDETKKATDERAQLAEGDATRQIEINKSTTERKLSDLELSHRLSNDSEKKYLAERDNLIYQSLKYEENLYIALLKNPALSPEKQKEIRARLKQIGDEIAQSFNATAIRNVESFNKALQTTDDIFRDFGLTVGNAGFQTGLAQLNKQLADPEITEAIRRYAESIGWTTEQLKELLRVQQEGKDKGLTTGTRERVVDDGLSSAATEQAGKGVAGGVAGILGGLFGGGVDPENKIKDQAEYMKAVHADLADSAKAAIGSMVQGLGQLAAQWISTGKFSAKAALQLVSGIASGLAIEAGLKALMQYAEGVALAANPFTAALAPGHFAAASAYAATAAAAAAVGVGTGLLARAAGGGSGSASSSAFKQSTASGSATGTNGETVDRNKAVIREEPRNSRQEVVHRNEVVIKLQPGLVAQEFLNDFRNLGDTHGAILRLVEG